MLLCQGRSLTVAEAPYGVEAPIITPTGVAFSFLYTTNPGGLVASTYNAAQGLSLTYSDAETGADD